MLFRGLLPIISKFLPGAAPRSLNLDDLAKLDPSRIYVENVRSILGITTPEARAICENALSQGLFRKGVEVRCPDDAVAITVDSESNIPESVHCWQTDHGELEEVELLTATLKKVSFYALNE